MLSTWGCATFPKPTLDLQFAGATSLDSRITFTRGSDATLFDSAGTLVYAKHNLLLQSQTFQTTWTTSQASVSADATTAPDGTTTADTLVENTANAEHYLRQSTIQNAGASIAFSVYVKAAGRTSIRLRVLDSAATSNGFFGSVDTSTGATASGTAGTGTLTSVTATALPNGWYRLVVVGIASPTATTTINDIFLLPTNQSAAATYTGDGTSGVFLWGAQLNLANMEGGVTSSLTTYYPTTTAAYYGPRFDYNPSTLAARGLLIEEARTNSIRNNTMQGAVAGTPGTLPTNWAATTLASGLSRQIVGTGTEDGITYADIRYSGTATGTSNISVAFEATNQIAATPSQMWANSVYVRVSAGTLPENFFITVHEFDSSNAFLRSNDVSRTSGLTSSLKTSRQSQSITTGVSTAFVRPLLYFTFTNGQVVDITLRIGLPQLEQGAFATSVIPTTATALTRNADVASMTGTNFSSWYNAVEGTLLAQWVTAVSDAANNRGIVAVDDGTNNNRVAQFLPFSAAPLSVAGRVVSGGVATNPANGGSIALSNVAKSVLAYGVGTDQAALCVNGGTVTTANPAAAPVSPNVLRIGTIFGVNNLGGHIQRISYYPSRLPNTTLQALTA